ncbi:two-component system [Desulfosarcina sp. BuS5]|uniref:PEP-CTERM-box response regulator transcription factor n=1 Tax=Desulfosarcina sp. BuS5 TaxID=933262 RepID=UPI0005506741|nr:PEP-CTERM-box response regulator transcription factor [Desulfosarcina sp. BuS5]WDN89659.1 two-component system [Desulfosarcina sp. BuS5]
MKKKLLVIEDEKSVAKQLRWGLGKEYEITIASGAAKARPLLASGVFPVATLDLGLPPYPDTPRQGFELLGEISSLSPHTRVIVITGNAEEENAVKAIALGAADFCAKPIDLKILKIILSRTFKIYQLEETNRLLQQQSIQGGSLFGMIGISPAMGKIFEIIRYISKTDYPVLITGSTGTGKEMAAHAVHSLSQRAEKPLVIINCGAIPENLLESELFGHEKGAFTGAVGRKIGKFEQADQGTIFLDEIGELPLLLQVKLLRFLQESTIERLGGTKTITLDTRIISATNIKLEEAFKQGTFREDLFYRLNVMNLKLPDLHERQEDILLLAHNFLLEETRKLQRGRTFFSPEAIAALTAHDWPGNVRELQNRIRRALGTTMDRVITPVALGLEEKSVEQEEQKLPTLKDARETAEKNAVRRALALSGNNITRAAKLLEISRPTLHDLLKKHGIRVRLKIN